MRLRRERRVVRIDTDPLGAIRKELVGAARRRAAARRRRRRAATAAATAMLTVVAVTGAGAVTGLGPDLSALEDALESIAFFNERGTEAEPDARVLGEEEVPRIPGLPELGLSGPDRSAVIELPLGDGGTALAVSFPGGAGQLCYTVTGSDRGGLEGTRAALSCNAATSVASLIQERDVYIGPRLVAPIGFVGGYVPPEVERVGIEGPSGTYDVVLADPWQPLVRGAPAVRMFAAVESGESERSRLTRAEVLARARGDKYSIELVMDDGTVVHRKLRGGS